jgi:hypothetical protein
LDVLIAPIGDQDPFTGPSDAKGPVLTLAEQIQPQRVYLLPTKLPAGMESGSPDNKETFAEALKTREQLLAADARLSTETVTIHLVIVADSTDYLHVFDALRGAARRITSEMAHVDSVSFHVIASSGTPAMQAGMLLMVNSGIIARPQDPPVRVYQVAPPEPGQESLVSRVDVSLLEFTRLVEQACSLFEGETFDSASVVLQRLAEVAANADRKQSALAAERYAIALRLHQRLAYTSARDALNELLGDHAVRTYFRGLVPVMRQQAAQLQRLIDGDRQAFMHDLLLGAERLQRAGAYADVMARSWRVVEATLRNRASSQFNIDVNRASEGGDGYVALLIKELEMCGDTALSTCLDAEIGEPLKTRLNARLRDRLTTGSRSLRDALFVEFKLARSWTEQVKPSEQEEPAVVRWALSRLSSTGVQPVSTIADLSRWVNVVRSHSVVAYGLLDVDDLDAEAALALAHQVVGATMGPLDEAYPFGLRNLQQVTTLLRQSLTAL